MIMFLSFVFILFSVPLYCLQYEDIQAGHFSQSGSTGFARFYQKEASFSLDKRFQFDQQVHQISSIQTSLHPILLQYNLLLHVGNRVTLRYHSETQENSRKLFVENQETMEQQGWTLKHIYFNEKNNDGRFAIWWEAPSQEGKILFYSILEEEGQLQLLEESVGDVSSVSYSQQPFKVVLSFIK